MGVDEAVEMATNTLDMMVARDLKGSEKMANGEMVDELLGCS
jgi:hypothetical protein